MAVNLKLCGNPSKGTVGHGCSFSFTVKTPNYCNIIVQRALMEKNTECVAYTAFLKLCATISWTLCSGDETRYTPPCPDKLFSAHQCHLPMFERFVYGLKFD